MASRVGGEAGAGDDQDAFGAPQGWATVGDRVVAVHGWLLSGWRLGAASRAGACAEQGRARNPQPAAARERLPRAWRKASSIRLRSCCASASRRPPTARSSARARLAPRPRRRRRRTPPHPAVRAPPRAATGCADHVFPVAGRCPASRRASNCANGRSPRAVTRGVRLRASRRTKARASSSTSAGRSRSGGMHRLPTSSR
ncbi:Uncharacterised protein [Pseudomonas aeruginosa]|nr:Uncharacterised protein [Pseudomonas aeruginosa]